MFHVNDAIQRTEQRNNKCEAGNPNMWVEANENSGSHIVTVVTLLAFNFRRERGHTFKSMTNYVSYNALWEMEGEVSVSCLCVIPC